MKAIYPPNDHTHSWLNCQKLFQWHPLIPQQEISFYTPAAQKPNYEILLQQTLKKMFIIYHSQ